MSTALFAFGLLAWFCNEPDIGCCCLAIAWILHGGSPDDDSGSHRPVGRRDSFNQRVHEQGSAP